VHLPDELIRRRVLVAGRVQGVGYRVACARAATAAGLAGVVRNLPDGRVEAIFEGPADRVAELVEWCRHGPSYARVGAVQVRDEPPSGVRGYEIG
jgi:acylphosphatase